MSKEFLVLVSSILWNLFPGDEDWARPEIINDVSNLSTSCTVQYIQIWDGRMSLYLRIDRLDSTSRTDQLGLWLTVAAVLETLPLG